MAENKKNPLPRSQKRDLLRVMLAVLIVCGGNGIGILAAAICWKFTGRLLPALGVAAGITAVALVAGILFLGREKGKNAGNPS